MERTRRTRGTTTLVGVALAASLWLAPSATAHPTGPTTRVPGPCALTRLSGETVQHLSARLIRCAAAKWTVPGGAARAICIARHESGLVPTATSATGKYLGLFQNAKRYWPTNYRHYTMRAWALKRTALNGRTNAVVSLRMAHDPAVGWRPWRGTGC
jgi:hypothetical protein